MALFLFQTFPYIFISLLPGSATVVWVCLRTGEFQFALWIYCAYVDPHFRPSFLRSPPPLSPVLIPPLSTRPLSKHTDPAMCSQLSLLLPSITPRPSPIPEIQQPRLTAVMTRDHKHYFPAAAKTLLTFTQALLRLRLGFTGQTQWLLRFRSPSTCRWRY